jgi:hypothetical protein
MGLHRSQVINFPVSFNQWHQLKHLMAIEKLINQFRVVKWVIQQNEHRFRYLF